MAANPSKYWVDDKKGHRGKCSARLRCPAMRMALATKTRGPGFDTALQTNMHVKPISMREIIVYRKAAADPGAAVNYCPWCGGKLYRERKKAKASA